MQGYGVLLMREIHFGGRLFVGSLGRIEVVGALEKLEVLLGLLCGRRLERNGIQPSLTLSFIGGMEEGYVFGRMFGTGMRLYAILSPLYFFVAGNKDVLVANVWELEGWSPSFTRPFND